MFETWVLFNLRNWWILHFLLLYKTSPIKIQKKIFKEKCGFSKNIFQYNRNETLKSSHCIFIRKIRVRINLNPSTVIVRDSADRPLNHFGLQIVPLKCGAILDLSVSGFKSLTCQQNWAELFVEIMASHLLRFESFIESILVAPFLLSWILFLITYS